MLTRRRVSVSRVLTSLLAVSLAGCESERGTSLESLLDEYDGPPPTMLLLNAPGEVSGRGGADGGILIRELCRQALLLSAHDHFGVPMRDGVLREPFPASPTGGDAPIDVSVRAINGHGTDIRVTRGKDDDRQRYGIIWIPSSQGSEHFNYCELITSLEQASRTTIRKTLERAGFRAPDRQANGRGPLPDEIATRLSEMNFIAQFNALRAIHRVIRDGGESRERLGGLVRVYANLGQLTQFHWNATAKVFQARALLYAERMVASAPKSVWALQHRAYARALVGLHAAALEDLGAAEEAAGANAGEPAAPTWVALLGPYCRYDTARLAALADDDPDNAALALLLHFLAVEHGGTTAVRYEAATSALAASLDCFRLHDAMCDIDELGIGHGATVSALEALPRILPDRLVQMPDCPRSVAEMLPKAEAPVKATRLVRMLRRFVGSNAPKAKRTDLDVVRIADIARALVAAGAVEEDRDEPSLSVLGRMLEELLFTQTARRGWFLRYSLGVSMDEYVDRAIPLVADHPYRAYIESFRHHIWNERARVNEIMNDVHIVDANHYMDGLFSATWRVRNGSNLTGPRAGVCACFHTDGAAGEIERVLGIYHGWPKAIRPDYVRYARRLRQVSPFAPRAIATLIERDWDVAEPHAKEWEERFGHWPVVKKALARHYVEAKEFARAVPYLEWCIRHAPEQWVYEQLAEGYRAQGDECECSRILRVSGSR